jgi:hypothetical protein
MARRHTGTTPRSRHAGTGTQGTQPQRITVDAGTGDRPVISDDDAKTVHGISGHWQCTFIPYPVDFGGVDPGGGGPTGRGGSGSGDPFSSSNRFIEIGRIASYDVPSNMAMISLISSTRLLGPMPVTGCVPRDMTLAGAACLAVLRNPDTPDSGVIVAVWPWPGLSAPAPVSSLGGKIIACGVTNVGVVASTIGSITVTLPAIFAGPPVVVATTEDTHFYAVVSGILAGSFLLNVVAQSNWTTTVPVNWIAVGN